jgi:protein tyrosine phosphatase
MEATWPDGKKHCVTQIHFTGWPDHGVPEGVAVQDFEKMLFKFIDWNLNSDPTEKAIVHCSAGIGRTGTTIGLMETIINICAQRNGGIAPEFSLFHTVRRLRE